MRTFLDWFVVLAIALAAMAGNSDARGLGGEAGRGDYGRAGEGLGDGFAPAAGFEPREGNAAEQALPNIAPVEPARRVLPPSIENVPASSTGAAIENVPAANVQAQDGVQNGANRGEQGGVSGGVQVAPVVAQSWKTTVARNRSAAAVTSILPCAPQVIDTGSTTYYVCGDIYYEQSYGPNGAIYTPVSGQ